MKYVVLGFLAAVIFYSVLFQVIGSGLVTTFISMMVSSRMAYLAFDAMEEDEINRILESLG